MEVSRRLDSERFSRSYETEERTRDELGFVDIKATWRPATDDELIEVGYLVLEDESGRDGGSGS